MKLREWFSLVCSNGDIALDEVSSFYVAEALATGSRKCSNTDRLPFNMVPTLMKVARVTASNRTLHNSTCIAIRFGSTDLGPQHQLDVSRSW